MIATTPLQSDHNSNPGLEASHDKCTRISVNGQRNNPEDYYWCPSPFNVTYGSEEYHNVAIFSNGGEVGVCPDFSKPPGSFQFFVMYQEVPI